MTVTDILYLDRPRARRLLGEVEGGVVEQVVNSVASRRSGHLSGKLPGLIEGGGESGGDAKVEETLSIDDALLSVVEETLDQAGLLVTADGLDDPAAWAEGRIHDQLAPAQVVRVTCQAQLIDPEFFASSVHRVIDALETIAIFAAGTAAMQKGANERKRMAQHHVKQILEGMPPELVRQLGDGIRKYFGEGLFIRQLPCGNDHRSYGLLGPLLTGALLDDRAAMFAKYGAAPSSWTVLSQIATVTSPAAEPGSAIAANQDDDGEDVDRPEFERLAGEMMVALEATGVSGGPVWPTITVSPIAVYRSISVQTAD